MILLMINLILSTMFLMMNHPMTMGLTLLLQTIIISMITGMLNINFWFSYILFLIMIGGMLVLFIYMTSIASNESFKYSTKMLMILMMMIFMSLLFMLIIDNYIINLDKMFNESLNISNLYKNNNLTKYFNFPSTLIILMMIMYLFITLIAVVKITKIEHGPLRQMF